MGAFVIVTQYNFRKPDCLYDNNYTPIKNPKIRI